MLRPVRVSKRLLSRSGLLPEVMHAVIAGIFEALAVFYRAPRHISLLCHRLLCYLLLRCLLYLECQCRDPIAREPSSRVFISSLHLESPSRVSILSPHLES